MSQKSTARTGSEGDVEFKEARNTNTVRAGSSSCKTKRDIFGGPFGDSPFTNRAQEAHQDYMLIMFRNNEESPGTSESSQADLDLYNLRNNYTEQLNLVRKKLNLMELAEEEPQRCTITEVVEDEPGSSKREEKVQIENCPVPQRPTLSQLIAKEISRPKKEYELTTIHPFSVTYNLESGSSTNIFEPDYSPPKKKVCQRLKTPRFTSVSEASLAYSTKVGIHESLFKKENNLVGKGKTVIKTTNQFSKTIETQCTAEEIDKINITQYNERPVSNFSRSTGEKFSVLDLSFETETEIDESLNSSERKSGSDKNKTSERPKSRERPKSTERQKSSERPKSGVIFPNVIIQTKKKEEESSLSSQSYKKYTTTTSSSNKDSYRKDSDGNVLPLNSVRDSSDDDSYLVKRLNTTIDATDKKNKSKKRLFKKQNKVSALEGATMWGELHRLRSGTDGNKTEKVGDEDAEKTGDPTPNICKLTNYVSQLSQNINLGDFIRNESEKSIQSGGKSKLTQYIQQYVQYKREVEGVRTSSPKKRNKHTIIGQRLVNIQNRILDSPDKLYQSETSLVSDEEKCEKLPSTPGTSETEERRKFWERICVCLCPRRYQDD